MEKPDRIEILGIPFDRMYKAKALYTLERWLEESNNKIIVTPNPEGVMQARRNPEFSAALCSADLSLADGIGIFFAAFFTKNPLPERVRGVDTIFALLENLSEKERNITAYFLGGSPGGQPAPGRQPAPGERPAPGGQPASCVAEAAKKNMEARFPNLKVTGFHHGFFSEEEEKDILAEINALSPDILLVCTGMPRAEIWATRNKNVNARLTMCLGGTLDIMAGNAKLAPAIMRRIGLEWLYRLFRQPSRAKRMLDIPRFIAAVLLGNVRK